MAAGHALLVVVGALLIGLLLNAADVRATAARQPAGWQRTLALALADPVWDLSRTLRLDQPRRAIDLALGRQEPAPAEPRETPPPSIASTTTTLAPTTSTTAPARREVSPDDPLRLFVGGDSMVGQFGPMLENRAARTGLVESRVVYEFESGLTRPDFVDWPTRLRQVAAEMDPDVVVLFFGGNDAQAIQVDGTWHDFGSEPWLAEYRARVAAVMDQVVSEGRELYWVGMPIVSSERFRGRVLVMNEVYRSEAEERPEVHYVDTWAEFTGPDGGYAEYLPDADGNVVDMRLNDGVHLTTAGGVKLAEVVFGMIDERWELAAVAAQGG